MSYHPSSNSYRPSSSHQSGHETHHHQQQQHHHHSNSQSNSHGNSHNSSGSGGGGGGGGGTFTPSMQRLMDKQREYEAFYKIHQQSTQLVQFLEGFSQQYDVLDGGSEAVGDVVEHWQTAFRATHLALASLEDQKQQIRQDPANSSNESDLAPERLVRIPVATGGSAV